MAPIRKHPKNIKPDYVQLVLYRKSKRLLRPCRQKPQPSLSAEDLESGDEIIAVNEEEVRTVDRPIIADKSRAKAPRDMKRRVRSHRSRVVHKHPRRGLPLNIDLSPVREEHSALPAPLEQVVRRPLSTAQASRAKKSRRKTKAQRNSLISLFSQRLQASNHWNGKLIRPHTILEWLEKSEPYHADYLLQNADSLTYHDGEDASDPVFGSELDAIINRFTGANIDGGVQLHDNIEVPKDYGMAINPYTVTGHVDHEALILHQDEQHNFMTRLKSGRRASKAFSETDDEDEEMLDALSKQIRSGQKPALDTVVEDDEVLVEDEDIKQPDAPAAPTPVPQKRGFDAVQVLKRHAISFDHIDHEVLAGSLDVAIHPIFCAENFHDCPDHIYQVLVPGLQLCTHLVTHRLTSPFWHTLMFGTQVPTAHRSVRRIPTDVPWSHVHAEQYEHQLTKFAPFVHFHFGLFPTPQHTMEYSYASMHPIKDHISGWQPKPGEPCRRSRIRLHTDFYTTARRLSRLRSADPAQVLRFNFFFAVNLAHEMAHFLWMSNRNTPRADIYSSNPNALAEVLAIDTEPEPYINDQPFNELGAAFETKVFGGRVEPISCRVDCAYGLTTSSQPNPLTTDKVVARTFYTIPMEFVAMMQTKETWERDVEGEGLDWRVFHIPRDGAVSVSVPFFDMTVWRDEAVDGVVRDKGAMRGSKTRFVRMEKEILRVEDDTNGLTTRRSAVRKKVG